MKTTSKKLSDSKVEIKVVLGKEELQDAREKAIVRLAKDLKLAGFRKGKVPAEVARQHLSENDINSVAADIAVRISVPDAFDKEKKAAIMIPKVEVTKYVPNETLEYTAVSDILPEIKLGDYKNLKAKKESTKVTEKDIKEIVDRIAENYADHQVVKRKAKDGDEVVIDFVGKKDGKAFDGGTAKNYTLKLGSGTFIDGFEAGIVGHESGDKFDLNLTFPKDYGVKDLAGQKVVFEVLLKQVNELTTPKLDDEFASKCGPFKTMDELKADIKKNLEMQNEHRAGEKYKDALVEELVKKSKVSAPEVMVHDQLHYIRDDISRNAQAQGMSFEDYLKQTGQSEEDWEKEASKIAEARVKASLVLQVLARDEKITVDDDAVSAKIAELSDVYQKAPEAIEQLKDPRVRQDIKNRMTIEKTLDYLVKVNTK